MHSSNQIVISKKIYNKETAIKYKAFLASLFIHASLLAATFYAGVFEKIPTVRKEERVRVSLNQYTLIKTPAIKEQSQRKVRTQKINKPKKVQKKIIKKIEKKVKKQPIQKVKQVVKTPQKSVQEPLKQVPPSEAFTPQQSKAETALEPKTVQSEISHTDSPQQKKELVQPKSSQKEISNKELALIRSMIQSALRYPAIAKKLKLEGVVMLRFCLTDEGYVEDLQIVSSSGSSTLDKRALQTVSSLNGEYPHLSKKVDLKIPISFSLQKS